MKLSVNIDRLTAWRHFLFWLSFVLFTLLNDGWQDNDTWNFHVAPQILTNLSIALFLVYLNLYLLMPRLYLKKKYIIYSLSLFLLLIAGGLWIRFFAFWLWIPIERSPRLAAFQPSDFWILARIVKNMGKLLPVIAITMVLKLMRNSYIEQKELIEIESERFKTENYFLRAQLNPHFFFNTLNSLYSLVLDRSDHAPKIVLKLADLMRYMIYDSSQEKVLLSNEIKHLKNYSELEQIRFIDRLDLSLVVSGRPDGKLIAPLLLLPFVENAFKHGIGDIKSWITIDIKISEDRIYLKVENSYSAKSTSIPHGIGLKNVKRRLNLLYPLKHTLKIEQEVNVHLVDLKIDL
ncbi:sensor histidine kinase YesM [Pedobacter cryoconitis]|uniref:Sensor histidine kinase YesM n=1 Tax=Pedobacter cryoconitis TaxID=188932 RepID=A0A7W8ZQI3_9SPHI|nr:histidine kinase [Pedobacter cryoconitis]MBB5638354.1 sensor histidine kinase YesM [Pedobacter cryoconitis]